jgi:hypothetical protein
MARANNQDQYILIDIEQRPGRHAAKFWRLTFQNLMTNQIAQMTVDPTYTNFRRSGWDHVVAHDCPWGVYSGLKLTKRFTREDMPVLSADSTASIVYRAESHEHVLALAQASIDAASPQARLQELLVA